jgi:alginate O-acetyltransferase complex protein AlgI
LFMVPVAAVLSVVGPTARETAQRFPARRWIGVTATVLLVAVLLNIGDDANADFIYAQF